MVRRLQWVGCSSSSSTLGSHGYSRQEIQNPKPASRQNRARHTRSSRTCSFTAGCCPSSPTHVPNQRPTFSLQKPEEPGGTSPVAALALEFLSPRGLHLGPDRIPYVRIKSLGRPHTYLRSGASRMGVSDWFRTEELVEELKCDGWLGENPRHLCLTTINLQYEVFFWEIAHILDPFFHRTTQKRLFDA